MGECAAMSHPYKDNEPSSCPYCGKCRSVCGTWHRMQVLLLSITIALLLVAQIVAGVYRV